MADGSQCPADSLSDQEAKAIGRLVLGLARNWKAFVVVAGCFFGGWGGMEFGKPLDADAAAGVVAKAEQLVATVSELPEQLQDLSEQLEKHQAAAGDKLHQLDAHEKELQEVLQRLDDLERQVENLNKAAKAIAEKLQ